MNDLFDVALLNLVQRDDSQTAEQIAERIALSPSAIARRLRRLRGAGVIARSIALLTPRLRENRVRALILAQLSEHADHAGKAGLMQRMSAADEVQFAYEVTGTHDIVALLDCETMDRLIACAEAVFAADSTIRRYETNFVRREHKFAPYVALSEAGTYQKTL